MAFTPADQQPAFKTMETAHAVIEATAKWGRGDRAVVSPAILAQYFLAVGSMTSVLCEIVADLQGREQVLNQQVADLMEYIVLRDATPEAHAAMAKAGIEYDLEETKRRLAAIAAKGNK